METFRVQWDWIYYDAEDREHDFPINLIGSLEIFIDNACGVSEDINPNSSRIWSNRMIFEWIHCWVSSCREHRFWLKWLEVEPDTKIRESGCVMHN